MDGWRCLVMLFISLTQTVLPSALCHIYMRLHWSCIFMSYTRKSMIMCSFSHIRVYYNAGESFKQLNICIFHLSASCTGPWAWTSKLHVCDGPLASGSQRCRHPGIQALLPPWQPIRGLHYSTARTGPPVHHHWTQWVKKQLVLCLFGTSPVSKIYHIRLDWIKCFRNITQAWWK